MGQALAASGVPRREVYLTTKIWTENLAADKLAASLEDSRLDRRDRRVEFPGVGLMLY